MGQREGWNHTTHNTHRWWCSNMAEVFLNRSCKCPEQEGLKETGRMIPGVQWGHLITAHLPSHCSSPSQACRRDGGLCFQVVETLDLEKQSGALGSNDSLEGWWVPSHRTNCPLLRPQAEPTYLFDPQKQIRSQHTTLSQAGCETDKMKNLIGNLPYKNEVQSNITKNVTKAKLWKIDNTFKIPFCRIYS